MSQVVSSKFQVFALQVLPLRGYNESGKPDGIDAYHMETLVADIKCLVKELGVEKFTLVRFTTQKVKTLGPRSHFFNNIYNIKKRPFFKH